MQQRTGQNTRYRLILTKASKLDWLTRDKHAMRDLCAVTKEGSHQWVHKTCFSIKWSYSHMQLTTHLDLHTYACLQAQYHPTDLLGRRIFPRLLFLMFWGPKKGLFFVILFCSNFHSLEALKACREACPDVFCSNFHGLATLEFKTCIESFLQLCFIL